MSTYKDKFNGWFGLANRVWLAALIVFGFIGQLINFDHWYQSLIFYIACWFVYGVVISKWFPKLK